MTNSALIKRDLLRRGETLIAGWCRINDVNPPTVVESDDPQNFGTCAYYRSNVIYISLQACALPGTAGRQWSHPGYVVDRTPYGVLAHELGHHVEGAHGARGGIVAALWQRETAEAPITTYAPNPNEWFAEIFRLFVTNPDLCRRLRPLTFNRMITRWPVRAELREWEAVLVGTERQIKAARNKIITSAVRKPVALF